MMYGQQDILTLDIHFPAGTSREGCAGPGPTPLAWNEGARPKNFMLQLVQISRLALSACRHAGAETPVVFIELG